MKTVQKYGWILGLICLPAGSWNIYLYLNGNGSAWNLGIGIFALCAGVFNLTVYTLVARYK